MRSLFKSCIVFTLILFGGCSKISEEDSIKFAISQNPQNLDPRYQSDAASERVSNLLYSPFFFFDEQYHPKSNLVSWEKISSLKYRFVIKNPLPIFHHGRVMNIDDIVGTLNELRELETSHFHNELKNVSSITKLSSQSFDIALITIDENFLSHLTFFVLPNDLLEKNHNFSENPIGSGSFIYLSNQPHLKIKRQNDGQIIELIEIKDPTVRILKLIKNEVDLIQNDLSSEMIKLLEQKNNIQTLLGFGSNVSYIGFNFNDPLLKEIKFRKALSLAIDRQALIKYFLNDKTRIADQILPPEHWASVEMNSVDFNPSLAKELIEDMGIRTPIEIILKTSTDPFRVKIATLLQNQLANVGVKLIIKSLDWGTYFRDIQAGRFQLYGLTWVGIRNPEIYEKIFSSKLTPPLGLNRGGYTNIDMDVFLLEAKRTNVWKKVIEETYTSYGFIPLWFEGNVAAFNKNISGYQISLDGSWDALNSIRKVNDDSH